MTSVLLVSEREVRSLISMAEGISLMDGVLRSMARGDATMPQRQIMAVPNRNAHLYLMPAELGSISRMGAKVISVTPANRAMALKSHPGGVLLFETTYGQLVAILDATAITAMRTAAVSAVATRALAREDATTLAILGSGVQAEEHLDAMLLCRQISRVKVWTRTAKNADAFASKQSRRHELNIEVMPTAHEAAQNADIICTTTAAKDPVLFGEWLAPGTHINAVGASLPTNRELSSSAIARGSVFVDQRQAALAEAGDFLLARQEGVVEDRDIEGEIGEVLLSRVSGRRDNAQITIFKSVGLGVEDVALANCLFERARKVGVGTKIALAGEAETAALPIDQIMKGRSCN